MSGVRSDGIDHIHYHVDINARLRGSIEFHNDVDNVQGLFGAAYWGLGRGFGTFVGGFYMKWLRGGDPDKTVGTRGTFRIPGVTAAIKAIVYFLFNIFYLRPRYNLKAENEKTVDNKIPTVVVTAKEGGVHNPIFVNDEQDLRSNEIK